MKRQNSDNKNSIGAKNCVFIWSTCPKCSNVITPTNLSLELLLYNIYYCFYAFILLDKKNKFSCKQ